MSAPVDVLAAEQAIEQMRGAADDYAGDNWPEMAGSLTKWADALDPCRAAVAELIRQMDRLQIRLDCDGRPGHCDYVSKADAATIIRAAIARCGGAK